MGMLNPYKIPKVLLIMASHVEIDVETSRVSLSSDPDAFVEAIFDLRNWTLKEEFFVHFPQWCGLFGTRKSYN